jgi:predicted glycoside hydrolase/deacetylase ChbG (UPF0249 family)
MIINADDFAMSRGTTAAIAQSFERGWCSSCSLMTNQPATEEAVELAHELKLSQHIGLHLVLNAGAPLSKAIRQCRRFCNEDGIFAFSREWPTFRLSNSEKAALADEIRAQIARCRREFHLPLTHMDSHINTHTEWAVGGVLLTIAREEQIPYVRLARNCGPGLGPLRRAYKALFNHRVQATGLARTRYIGSIEDCLYLLKRRKLEHIEPLEVMVHPDLDDEGNVINLPNGELLEESVQKLHGYEQAVSFSGHRYNSSASSASRIFMGE